MREKGRRQWRWIPQCGGGSHFGGLMIARGDVCTRVATSFRYPDQPYRKSMMGELYV